MAVHPKEPEFVNNMHRSSFRNALDFRFLFAYSTGGRGNGKRVARRLHCRLGSHESAATR